VIRSDYKTPAVQATKDSYSYKSFAGEIEGLNDFCFRAIQKFGAKTHPPGPVKVNRIYSAEKKKSLLLAN